MRLIDVDDPKLYEKVYCPQDWSGIGEYPLMIEWGDLLDAPLVDAVKVVRCKDCKHCDPESYHCDHHMGTAAPLKRKPDDFCSYGERKTNVEVQDG